MTLVKHCAILTVLLHGAVAGCEPRPAPRISGPAPAPAAPSGPERFDPEYGAWRSEGEFACQIDAECDRRAYCANDRYFVEVDEQTCSSCDGQACDGSRCAPLEPARECPSGTICRYVADGLGRETAACVNPALLADAGAAPVPEAGVLIGNCGNGVRDYVLEICDDGNQVSGDGCTGFCTLEPGWSCGDWGDPCVPALGDLACSANACRLGTLCLEPLAPQQYDAVAASCVCPAVTLPECPTLAAVGLPLPPSAADCSASGISADGGTIVGSCILHDGPPPLRAFRWTIAGGPEAYPAGGSGANAVNADGTVVVGWDQQGPFIWTPDEIIHLDVQLGRAVSVSDDGRVVVGGQGPASPAWVWTAEAGVRLLPPSTAGRETGAVRVSGDGRLIIGFEIAPEYIQVPLTWSVDGEVSAFPLPPETRLDLVDLSADGAVMVSNDLSRARASSFISVWTPEGRTELDQNGVTALSADGRVVLGNRGALQLGQSSRFERLLPFPQEPRLAPFAPGIGPELDISASDVSADGRVVAVTGVTRATYRTRAFFVWRR